MYIVIVCTQAIIRMASWLCTNT